MKKQYLTCLFYLFSCAYAAFALLPVNASQAQHSQSKAKVIQQATAAVSNINLAEEEDNEPIDLKCNISTGLTFTFKNPPYYFINASYRPNNFACNALFIRNCVLRL